MYITRFQLAALSRQSLADVIDGHKGNICVNPRSFPAQLRRLIDGYMRFLGLLSSLCDKSLSEGDWGLPVKAMLKAIELEFDNVTAGMKPEGVFARAMLARLDENQGRAAVVGDPKIERIKKHIMERCGELSIDGVAWACDWLDTTDPALLVEELEIRSSEVSRYLLDASYSDCARTRRREFQEGSAREDVLTAIKAIIEAPGATVKWRAMIKDLSGKPLSVIEPLPNTLCEPDHNLMKTVVRFSQLCDELQGIADTTPGMWHGTFNTYQLVLLGVYGYELSAMQDHAQVGYWDAKQTISAHCADLHLPENHRALMRVKALVEDALQCHPEGDRPCCVC